MNKPTTESPEKQLPKQEQKAPVAAANTADKASVSSTGAPADKAPAKPADGTTDTPTEHGGAKGLEPTRYGDWERNGRCTDF